MKENLAGKNKTRGRSAETRELLRLLRSLYQGRLQAEYSGMKVVFFYLCFKLKAMFTFPIFETYFSLILFERTTVMEAKQIDARIGD